MSKISGAISLCLGVLILILNYLFVKDSLWIATIYGVPFTIVGFIIIFRKNENSIEQINYGRLKNNDKK